MEIESKVQFDANMIDSIIDTIESNFAKYYTVEFIKKSDSMYTDLSDSDTASKIKSGGRVVRIRLTQKLPKSSVKNIFKDTDNTKGRYNGVRTGTWFTCKQKQIKDNYENNEEHETIIDDPKEMDACLNIMGYHCWFNKTKFAYGITIPVNDIKYHVEIERVVNETNGKSVLFVEIENTENEKASIDEIQEGIDTIFTLLGLDPNSADARPWFEILK
jgi:adenylate cyclase class IV